MQDEQNISRMPAAQKPRVVIACRVMKPELKNYTRIAMIDTQSADMEPLRRIARENAAFLEKEYAEIPGRQDYFMRVLFGPYPEADFIHLQAGETMQQEMIIDT